jgi:NAD(P)-dependent dehydrogenase (short-subunit alcohol dehydrogenase family)
MTAKAAAAARPAVLVTGASKGIGEACTLLLAREGYVVYAGVRREEDGEALQQRGGDAVIPIMLDVTRDDQVAAAAARIAEETGGRGLQALVNNAGVAIAGPMEFLPMDELRRQMDINFIGQIAVTQAMLPLLRQANDGGSESARGGARIVFMSSISGRTALPLMGAYAASKFAMEAAADSMRVELRPFGIRVVLVEPGVITTPIWATARETGDRNIARMPPEAQTYYGRMLDALRRRVGSGMRGNPPERVAQVVLRAIAGRNPRPRYMVGNDARARLLMHRLLPNRVEDWVIAAAVKRL